MASNQAELNRPIRVMVFGGGPVLERGIKQFLCRLDDHPEIELLGVIVQSKDHSFRGVVKDLWRRRRFLAIPLLLAQLGGRLAQFQNGRQAERMLGQKLAQVSNCIYHIPDIHAPEVLELVRRLAPDLGLIYGAPILKPLLFEIPTFGTLGIHHGKVPEYRGKKTTFWAVYNGEKVAGVTIQKVNAGLDTGEIAKQGEVPIGKRPLSAVWKEINDLGLDLYIQAILEVKRGTATFRPQPVKKGKLYRDPKLRDILHLWLRQRMGPVKTKH